MRVDLDRVILGHARTSMTLDTYAHLFEEARHGADVRAELAKSEFANLLARTHEPPVPGGEHVRGMPAALPRPGLNARSTAHRCGPRTPSPRRCYLTKT